MPLYDLVLFWLTANVFVFAIFGWDKIAAQSGSSRVSERSLLGLTLIGGVGAMAASSLFRHKTRKQPFRRYAVGLCLVHVLICAFVLIAFY